jgi:hypothetical protein
MNTSQRLSDTAINAKILHRFKSEHSIRCAQIDGAALYESFMSAMFAENLQTLIPRAFEPSLAQVTDWLTKHTTEHSLSGLNWR